MAKNIYEPRDLEVKKAGGALIGGGALNGEFTVYVKPPAKIPMVKQREHKQTNI